MLLFITLDLAGILAWITWVACTIASLILILVGILTKQVQLIKNFAILLLLCFLFVLFPFDAFPKHIREWCDFLAPFIGFFLVFISLIWRKNLTNNELRIMWSFGGAGLVVLVIIMSSFYPG